MVTTPAMLLICCPFYRFHNAQIVHVQNDAAVVGNKFSRQTGVPPSLTSCRATWLRAMGITSAGSGNSPNMSTSLLASAMQTNLRLAPAIIFPGSRPAAAFDQVQVTLDSSAPSI